MSQIEGNPEHPWDANEWTRWIHAWKVASDTRLDKITEQSGLILNRMDHADKWVQHVIDTMKTLQNEQTMTRVTVAQWRDEAHVRYQTLASRVTTLEARHANWAVVQTALALLLSGVGAALGWLLARTIR